MQGTKYAIAVLSNDRIGIISNVTGAVAGMGANIDTISQTVLDGLFTLLLTAVFPDAPDADTVRRTILEHGAKLDLDVNVRPYQPPRPSERAPNPYFLTASGPDRPGLFHEITGALASHGVNILDLYCSLKPGDKGEDFLLVSELDIPPDRDLEQLRIDLEETGREDGFQVRIQHENLFQATSNLYITRREVMGST